MFITLLQVNKYILHTILIIFCKVGDNGCIAVFNEVRQNYNENFIKKGKLKKGVQYKKSYSLIRQQGRMICFRK